MTKGQARLWIDADDSDEWQMDEGVRLVGREGVQQAREAMQQARES